MTRLCALAAIAVMIAMLGGCAAADPTGGVLGGSNGDDDFGESTAAVRKSRCPAGEMLTCELKSPNRVSDGRYGFRKGKMQRCSCRPEREVLDLGQATLPRDSR